MTKHFNDLVTTRDNFIQDDWVSVTFFISSAFPVVDNLEFETVVKDAIELYWELFVLRFGECHT